jgi:DNA-directed RNA polymerase subunit RPC12/RpoP
MTEELETDFTSEIICPHCGAKYQDSWELNNNDGEKETCIDCGKHFHLSVHFDVTYSTRKI